jgi:peptidoglycan/LPS O-acetylase OafA/YrhL
MRGGTQPSPVPPTSEAGVDERRNVGRPTIEALIGIRGIAAIWVLFEHFRFALYDLFPATKYFNPWIVGANLGIEIFFPLSGFVISYMYADRFRTGATRYGDYLVKRFARVYPVFLVTLLAFAVLVGAAAVAHVSLNSSTRYTPLSFIGNILLLQAAPGIPAWNPPAWSISSEALAYVSFPLIVWLLARLNRSRSAAIGALAWLIAGTAAMMTFRLVNPIWTSPGMMLLRIMTEFAAGAMLWKAWSLAGEPQSPRWDVLAGGAFVFVVVALPLLPQSDSFALVLTPVMSIFVVALAGARGPIRWLLSRRLVIFGGKISYSLYMVHFIVFAIVGKVLRWEPFETSAVTVRLGLMAFYFLTCIAIAIACYFLVEEPARRAIQRIAAARENTP